MLGGRIAGAVGSRAMPWSRNTVNRIQPRPPVRPPTRPSAQTSPVARVPPDSGNPIPAGTEILLGPPRAHAAARVAGQS
ncbi:hypothetical protein Nans01_46040 [Nocardiopsis ansamitocini]|uniref:Uncharacterized protein n=1 Tax=Nocardiopsis ansamitocini TaxID=1670832 RepID=A0A9W6UL33_9ACTN|nr:hypothetical protein Nans01_46040 [Nocardiopsis ansamitocini]